MLERVKNGIVGNGELNCVFVSLLAKNTQPYLNHEEPKELREREAIIPMVIAQMRWDGVIGFPGGKVDEEDKIDGVLSREGLLNALSREMNEEINYPIEDINRDNFIDLCTFKSTDEVNGQVVYIHHFVYPIEANEIRPIISRSLHGEHSLSENCGSFAFHLSHYGEVRGINSILQHKFSGTAKEELIELIKYVG